jgi:glycosyltransferase involved in cell wall biosynthesis
MDNYPPLYLVGDMLSRDQILGLHKAGDCLVSLDRGEGFGLVPFEAGACENPIIVTGLGGVTEYAKPEHSYIVNYTMTPVFGMPQSPWYRGDQMWAEPDLGNAVRLMRHVYKHQEEASNKGRMLKHYIAENLSWDKMGMRMTEVIKSL